MTVIVDVCSMLRLKLLLSIISQRMLMSSVSFCHSAWNHGRTLFGQWNQICPIYFKCILNSFNLHLAKAITEDDLWRVGGVRFPSGGSHSNPIKADRKSIRFSVLNAMTH